MNNNELYHYSILGMKWGVRRFQNKDGSLTPEGKRAEREAKYNPKYDEFYTKMYGKKGAGRIKKRMIDKGYSRQKAVRTELGRQFVINSLIIGRLAFSTYQGMFRDLLPKAKELFHHSLIPKPKLTYSINLEM